MNNFYVAKVAIFEKKSKDQNKKLCQKALLRFLAKFVGTGGGIRTPINGFGDRYSTLELHPYFKKVLRLTSQNFFIQY